MTRNLGRARGLIAAGALAVLACGAADAAVPQRLIVKFSGTDVSASGDPAVRIDAALRDAGYAQLLALRPERRLGTGAELFQVEWISGAVSLDAVADRLARTPGVRYATPDKIWHTAFTPNDTLFNQQWHYFEATGGLNLPLAWDIARGTGQVVAVIDTGFRPHADLAANLLPGFDFISDVTTANDGNGRDGDAQDPGDNADGGSSWHGTHVAGTIGAVTNNNSGVAGVAHLAKVVSVRVLGVGGGSFSDILDGMVWAAGGPIPGVPANANPAKVLNLSLGGAGTCDASIEDLIAQVHALGTTIIVAAGNDTQPAIGFVPGGCEGMISVGANNRAGLRAFYSNFGFPIDIAAPGGETDIANNGVLSTLNAGNTSPAADNFEFYQGTSMATPHVAGVAALIYQVRPNITPAQLECVLMQSSRPFAGDLDGDIGVGIVDARAAVLRARDTASLPSSCHQTVLANGVALNIPNTGQGSRRVFRIAVPAGRTNLQVSMTYDASGGGDADMYVRRGAVPTLDVFDCRPFEGAGVAEICGLTNPPAGDYFVMIDAFTPYAGLNLVATFVPDDQPVECGAPTAVDDVKRIAPNSTAEVRVNVLLNDDDTFDDNRRIATCPMRITSVATPTQGGTVRVHSSGQFLFYTPPPGGLAPHSRDAFNYDMQITGEGTDRGRAIIRARAS